MWNSTDRAAQEAVLDHTTTDTKKHTLHYFWGIAVMVTFVKIQVRLNSKG